MADDNAEVQRVSWDQFKKVVMNHYAEAGLDNRTESSASLPLFRGHSRTTWLLSSQWERALQGKQDPDPDTIRKRALPELEKILRDFQELATGVPGLHSKELDDDIEWWAVGRHFGLITPLLDWSNSPYVAAFFAFTGFLADLWPGYLTHGEFDWKPFLALDTRTDVAIWALRPGPELTQAEDFTVLTPRVDIGHRQRAQRGVFTHLQDERFLDLESFLSHRGLAHAHLRKYLIPAKYAPLALSELRLMNITFATLFPDLHGAALQANFETLSFVLLTMSAATGGDT